MHIHCDMRFIVRASNRDVYYMRHVLFVYRVGRAAFRSTPEVNIECCCARMCQCVLF